MRTIGSRRLKRDLPYGPRLGFTLRYIFRGSRKWLAATSFLAAGLIIGSLGQSFTHANLGMLFFLAGALMNIGFPAVSVFITGNYQHTQRMVTSRSKWRLANRSFTPPELLIGRPFLKTHSSKALDLALRTRARSTVACTIWTRTGNFTLEPAPSDFPFLSIARKSPDARIDLAIVR